MKVRHETERERKRKKEKERERERFKCRAKCIIADQHTSIVLQCVAVRCSELQCVAVSCRSAARSVYHTQYQLALEREKGGEREKEIKRPHGLYATVSMNLPRRESGCVRERE